MKKIIIVLAFLWYFLGSYCTIADYMPVEAPKPTVDELITLYSTKYDVSHEKLFKTLKCENTYFDVDKQSELKYKSGNRWKKPAGSREESYGLAQIHLPDHPEISYQQAIDPDFAIEFLAKNLSQGKGRMWSCYNMLFNRS
jgi:hypothetical protein